MGATLHKFLRLCNPDSRGLPNPVNAKLKIPLLLRSKGIYDENESL